MKCASRQCVSRNMMVMEPISSFRECLDTESGIVVAWGWNEHGMCGTGDEKDVVSPRPVSALRGRDVRLVGCGHGHSFAYMSSNEGGDAF